MAIYIHQIIQEQDVADNINSLISNAGLRRRMSKQVRLAVATGIEALKHIEESEEHKLNKVLKGIITATGFGLIEDSEKFLCNIIENGNELLNPTAFIQSTFNTVGANISLLKSYNGYNMTYVDNGNSLVSALQDAILLLNEEDDSAFVLLTAFDEFTEHIAQIIAELSHSPIIENRAISLLLSNKKRDIELNIELKSIEYLGNDISEEEFKQQYSSQAHKLYYKDYRGITSSTINADTLIKATEELKLLGRGHKAIIYDAILNANPTIIALECI